MDATPIHGDFVIESLRDDYFTVRREGVDRRGVRKFNTFEAATAYALEAAYSGDARTFLKRTDGYLCLD